MEDEICDLTINGNLEVKGKLKLNGSIAAEICNIYCPENFNVTAGRNVNMTAVNDITLSAPGPGTGDITITNEGAGTGAFIDLLSDDSILLQSQGTGANRIHLEIPTQVVGR